MAKKKKAKSSSQTLKQQAAQYRNTYIRRLIALGEAMDIDNFRSLAGADGLRVMFELRMRNNPVMPASPDIPVAVYKQVREFHDEICSHFTTALYEGGPEVSLRDFLCYGQTIYFFAKAKHELLPLDDLRGKLEHYINALETEALPYFSLNEALWSATMHVSEIDGNLYWLDHKFVTENHIVGNQFLLHAVRPEKRKICIDGIHRPVYRVGWTAPKDGPMWLEIQKKVFDPAAGEDEKMPVYIQPHALHRMEERLDCITKSVQHFNLFTSLFKPEVIQNHTGQWLIAYRYLSQKLGYLLVHEVDGVLVIRTFLFLTMDSTPEGKSLQDAIGLEAVDKKYLAIDRLSTFLMSDIAKTPDIKEYFLNAGCADLFNFDTSEVQPEHQIEVAKFMRSYLDVARDKEENVMPLMQETPLLELQEAMAS